VLYAAVYFRLFTLQLKGDLLALGVITGIFLLSVIYMSIFLSSFFTRKIIALQTIAFTSYPIFFMSGYSWPKAGMPLPLQWCAQLLPSTHYFTAAVRIMEMNAGWREVMPELWWLLGLAAAGLVCTRLRMRALLRSSLT
jgi:ABC-2 type transport system permease protein